MIALGSVLALAGSDWGAQFFLPPQLKTYLDHQTEEVLGRPVPKKELQEYRIFVFGGFSFVSKLSRSLRRHLPHKRVRIVDGTWQIKRSGDILQGVNYALKYQPDLYILYVGADEIPLSEKRRIEEEEYREILQKLRGNMKAVMRLARRRRVDVVVLSIPANLQESLPLLSYHRRQLRQGRLQEWNVHFEHGKGMLEGGFNQEALEAFKKAERIDPTYAELQHKLGKVYERLGNYEEAKRAYESARDLDGLPLRAGPELNRALKEAAAGQPRVFFVDIAGLFERLSPHGIVSSELIFDHVHLSPKGQKVVADEILRVLAQTGKIAPPAEWKWKPSA